MKKALLFFLIMIFFSSNVWSAPGDLLFEDDFLNRNYIDEGATTAIVDTSNGEIRLPYVSSAGGMAAGNGVVIAQNGVNVDFYVDGGSSFLYQGNYSSPNTLVLAMRSNSVDHFRLNDDGTGVYMTYAGSEFISIPSLALSGLDSIVSMTWMGDKLIGLDMEQRQLRQFTISDTGTWLELPSISLDVENPIQVTSMGSDLVVLDENGGMSVYAYTDDLNAVPVVELSGSDATVITSDTNNNVIGIADTKILQYQVSDSIMQSLVLNEPTANHEDIVSLNPGVILIRDGQTISEYAFTGDDWVETGRTIVATGRSLTYLSPRNYVSRQIYFANPVKGVQLVTEYNIPPGTTIDFYVSIEGEPFEPFNGIVKRSYEFQNVVLKAVLSTNVIATPRLQNVKIYDRSLFIDQFIVTDMVRNPGNVLPTSAPVDVVAGYRFDFEVTAPGADEVGVSFTDGAGEILLTPTGSDKFTGNYFFDYTTPSGSQFDVTIRAKEYTNGYEITHTLPSHFTIVDSIYESANIYTGK